MDQEPSGGCKSLAGAWQDLAGAFKCWLPLSRSGYEGRLYVVHVSLCAINTMSAIAISAPGAISVINTMSDTNT